jgi:hypothetical protein
LYGLDGYGNTCGAKNSWNGTSGPDLTAKKKVTDAFSTLETLVSVALFTPRLMIMMMGM